MMNRLKTSLLCAAVLAFSLPVPATLVSHFPMDVISGQIVDNISGNRFAVQGNIGAESAPGAVGSALRFDGFSSYVDARLNDVIPSSANSMTVSMWVAVPCYPIVEIDVDNQERIVMASCLDEENRSGFGFYLGKDGSYAFRTFIGGWPVNVEVTSPLPVNQWCNLTAVVDGTARTINLYNNGVAVGSARANGVLPKVDGAFRIGHGPSDRFVGPFNLMAFNGLVDDIKVWDEAVAESTIKSWKAENKADLIVPSSRYAENILRPAFHGMPGAAWTNETHGMTFSDGRYHVFFQKNANGPYMARLHWGHISSDNLYDWREEPIAFAPDTSYDVKGCWSGCVFTDPEITGDRPAALYTGVDYVRAVIAMARPLDDDLLVWEKDSRNPLINGRPQGLSDDFRDPYFFRTEHGAYMLVGSSKDGLGTTTLHVYDPVTKSWSNDGRIFFSATDASQGTFWEMPNVTRMADGRWLFTATPLHTSQGVRTLYWVGKISENGTFLPESGPKTVELSSHDGFGLLSPTVFNHDGKTIALGIVPDKLSGEYNYRLGWAHCYSLPREWSLAADGSLVQKPFSGLAGLRSGREWSFNGELSDIKKIETLAGNKYEILASFKVGDSSFGFSLFDNGSTAAKLYYNPASGELVADFSEVERWTNDRGVYDGVYRMPLPKRPATGESLKINVFVDGSILDIFVNDMWAQSIRVFPQDDGATGVSLYADKPVNAEYVCAWNLKPSASGVNDILADYPQAESEIVDVWHISGSCIRPGVNRDVATENLDSGIYIIDGKKYIVK